MSKRVEKTRIEKQWLKEFFINHLHQVRSSGDFDSTPNCPKCRCARIPDVDLVEYVCPRCDK